MTTAHYAVFVGVGAALSDSLKKLERGVSGLKIVAPAVKDSQRGVSDVALSIAAAALAKIVAQDGAGETARLSVWAFEADAVATQRLWKHFGRSAWIEYIPVNLTHHIPKTLTYLGRQLPHVGGLLHEISLHVFQKRKSSPLVVPLGNFESRLLRPISQHWYRGLDKPGLSKAIRSLSSSFRQRHTRFEQPETYYHRDERGLHFSPAKPEICHGQPHPTGSNARCFIDGRFRFGAAVFPGFHYDVRVSNGNLQAMLYDCCGSPRDVSSEKREYINIFPNDHLLPLKN